MSLSTDREPTTEQRKGSTKVQFTEPMSFIVVTSRSMGERLLTGREMTQRQPYHQSPPSMDDSSQKLGNLEHTQQPVGSLTD